MGSRKAVSGIVGIGAVSALLLSGCAGTSDDSGTNADGTVSGDITYITGRTDRDTDGTFDKYIKEFQKEYPDVNVTIEALTDYNGDLQKRMSTPNGYGDVLGIPVAIPKDQWNLFFEPLGDSADFTEKYIFVDSGSYDGTQYGLTAGGNASGILYNATIWADAGITDLPTTPDEFLADLQTIGDTTDAIPLYTNYKDGWPLGDQWTLNAGSIDGNADVFNEMNKDTVPWKSGSAIDTIDSIIFDAVDQGLTEPDPLTTNWEQSKGDLATGKIATMALGSWAITQFRAAATDAGLPEDTIGYMPFPANVEGQQYAMVASDGNLAINKNSKYKEASKAWIDFLIEDSGSAEMEGFISGIKDAPLPSTLVSLQDAGVELLEYNPAPEGEDSLQGNIIDKSKIDLHDMLYRQKLIDVARGQADGDKKSYFADLDKRWGDAVESVG